jgi:hypothetical protein
VAHLRDAVEVAAEDAGVHLADLGEDFAGAMVFDVNLVEALVGLAFAEGGEMGDAHERRKVMSEK